MVAGSTAYRVWRARPLGGIVAVVAVSGGEGGVYVAGGRGRPTTTTKTSSRTVRHGDVWHLGDVVMVCCTADEMPAYRGYARLVDGQMIVMAPERAGMLGWLIDRWEQRTGNVATLIDCRGTDATPDPAPAPEPGTTGAVSPWVAGGGAESPERDARPGDIWKIGEWDILVDARVASVEAMRHMLAELEALSGTPARLIRRMATIPALAEDPNPARQD